jgi:hypothetical protein
MRVALDASKITSSSGSPQRLVFTLLGLTYTEVRNAFPEGTFDNDALQLGLYMVLCGLDFLHGAELVHTGKMAHTRQGIHVLTDRIDSSPNNTML